MGRTQEQAAVVGHIEHLHKGDTPRITVWPAFIDQHRRGSIELLGEFSVLLAAEHRAGAGVGIKQADLVGGQGEAALRLV